MQKRINYFILILTSFCMMLNTVLAADFGISLTSNSVTVGNTVSLKIDGTASGLTGRFNVSTSDASVASLSASYVWVEDNSQYVTITAKKAGTAVITVSPTDGISDRNAEEAKLTSRTIKITVNAPKTSTNNGSTATPRVKSSNNFLSSLTVDGATLDPKFDREVLEYAITLPAETEKIKINAQLADSNSRVAGTGEVTVKTGLNTFEIVVTAENGSKRTYTLKATVQELTPINVTVDDKTYSVIRKRKDLPKISDYFTEKEITIGEEVVEGYYNDTLKYEVVGLQDEKGNINYYIYKDNKYILYREYTFGAITLQLVDKELDKNYIKTSFTYDGDKIVGYQIGKINIIKNTYALDTDSIVDDNFYLFYGKNVETGKVNLYQYDALEKTIQRYNVELLDMYKKTNSMYYLYLLGAILIVGVLVLLLALILIRKGTKKTKPVKTKRKKDIDFDLD